MNIREKFSKLSLIKKLLVVGVLVLATWFIYSRFKSTTTQQTQYQTTQVERGTLIVSVTGSGSVANTNSTPVTTQASGVVKTLYVKDGDTVTAGQAIGEIELDQPGKQNQSQALATYQSAQNNVNNAQATYYSLQSTLYSNWDKFMNLAQNSTYENGDGSPNVQNRENAAFITTNDDWLAAEAKYKNQALVVSQAQNSLNAAALTYRESSPTVYAPISGKISGLSLQVGSVIISTSGTTTSSTTTTQSTKVGNIVTEAYPIVSVNLTQIDVPTVHIGDKVTLTFDALSDKTFTGKLVSIDTSGSVSSGVTTYPALIMLDTKSSEIYPNMSATANIITQTKTDALVVPNAAVQTQDGQATVRVMKNGVEQSVNVTTGISSDTQTEITSGLSEGDTVITGTTSTQATSSQTTSVFGGGLRLGGFGGGNTVRVNNGGTTNRAR